MWKPIENKNNYHSFQLEDEPQLLHVIKTSHVNEQTFIVVHEDAYQFRSGRSEILSKDSLLEKYGININQNEKNS